MHLEFKQRLKFFLAPICYFLVVCFTQIQLQASVSVIATGGILTATYANLGAAVSEINNGVHQGYIVISIESNTNEPNPIILNSGSILPANYLQISIVPSGNTRDTISGSVSNGALFTFNGASNVIIDGGIDKRLYFRNTNLTSPSVFWFKSGNSVDLGCYNNTIRNCEISNNVMNQANSFGIAFCGGLVPNTTLAAFGHNNLIANNKIYNAFCGINVVGVLDTNNNSFEIVGNEIGNVDKTKSIYKYGVYVNTFDNFKIENNKIFNINGGNISNGVFGIYIESTKQIIVKNNLIFSISTSSTASSIPFGPIAGIYLKSNSASTVSKNIISGNQIQNVEYLGTENKNIDAYGIYIFASSNSELFNNIVNNVLGSGFGSTTNDFTYGIWLNSSNNVNIYHNSVNLRGIYKKELTSGINFSAALGLTDNSMTGLNIKNNIFANSITQNGITANTKSYAVYSASGILFSGANVISNNNYYITGTNPNTGYGNNFDLATYSDWQTFAVTDIGSITTNPLFNFSSNAFTIQPNSPAISSGIPVGILIDINNELRSLITPSLGANEIGADVAGPNIDYIKPNTVPYSSVYAFSNVSITDNFSGVSSGNKSPKLYFKKSTDPNTQASWKSVNAIGNTSPYTFNIDYSLLNNPITVGDVIQYFIVAQDMAIVPNFNISSGVIVSDSLKDVALSSSNFPVLGTIDSYTISAVLQGVQTVGVGGAFNNFTGANGVFASLNTMPVTGDLTFKVISNIVEPGTNALTAMNNPSKFTVKIVPDGENERVISGAVATGSLIRITKTEGLIIDGSFNGKGRYLTFRDNAVTANALRAAIQLYSSSTTSNKNITIKNCNIWGYTCTVNNNFAVALYIGDAAHGTTTASNNDSISILNNAFYRASFGVRIGGSTTASAYPSNSSNDYITISNNAFGSGNNTESIMVWGMQIFSAPYIHISKNEVYNMKSTQYYKGGIYLNSGCNGALIDKNIIHGIHYIGSGQWGVYGIQLTGATANPNRNVIFSNNLIYDVVSDAYSLSAQDNAIGLKVDVAKKVKFYHNTINLYGNFSASGTNYNSHAFLVSGAASSVDSLDIRNNIFVNTMNSPSNSGAGGCYAITFTNVTTWANHIIDYNNYFSNSNVNALTCLGYSGGRRLTLADWRTVTSQDANSNSIDPEFMTQESCMPSIGGQIFLSGTPVGVLTDFIGKTRSLTNPSLGIYEEMVDVIAPEISYTKIPDIFVATNQTLNVLIVDNTQALHPTNLPRLYYKKINQPNDSASWKYSVASGTYPDYNFTIDIASLGGLQIRDKVQYFIVAQDQFDNITLSDGLRANYIITSTTLPANAFPITGSPVSFSYSLNLSGVKTVGVGGDYPNLTGTNGVFNDLNDFYVGGDLTFKVISNINEPGTVALNQINKQNPAYIVKIAPDTNTLRTLSGNYNGGLFRFNGIDGIGIDGSFNGSGKFLKFVNNTGNNSTSTFQLISNGVNRGCKNISIINSIIQGPVNNNINTFAIYAGDATISTNGNPTFINPVNGNHNNITIVNNSIYRGNCLIFYVGNASKKNMNWNIKKNTIGSSNISSENKTTYAIFSGYTLNSVIDSNKISDLYTISTSTIGLNAIYCKYDSGMIITNNRIQNIQPSAGAGYIHNMIYGIYQLSPIIRSNTIENVKITSNFNYLNGIFLTNYSRPLISGNIIRSLTSTSGVNACKIDATVNTSPYLGDSAKFVNNSISGISSTKSNVANVVFSKGTAIVIKYNSINMFTDVAPSYNSYGISVEAGNTVIDSIFNNTISANIKNVNGTSSFAFCIAYFQNAPIRYINYNNYYINNAINGNFVGAYLTNYYRSLFLWQQFNQKDSVSISEDPLFVSDLALAPTNVSPLFNSGLANEVNTDIMGTQRDSLAPTIGAYEKEYDFYPPIIEYNRIQNTSSFNNRIINANIYDIKSGVDTLNNSPKLYFKKANQPNDTSGWKLASVSNSGNNYSFSLDYSLIGGVQLNDRIQFFIVAADLAYPSNLKMTSGAPFTDISSTSFTSSYFPIIGNVEEYVIASPIAGVKTVGVGGDYASLTGDVGGLFRTMDNCVVSGDLTIKIISDLNESGNNALRKLDREGGNWKVKIIPNDTIKKIVSGIREIDGLIRIQDVSGLTIDGINELDSNGLEFKNLAVVGNNATIQISGSGLLYGSKNITIKNCNISAGSKINGTGAQNAFLGSLAIYIGNNSFSSINEGNNDSISIINNNIYNAFIGIGVAGSGSNDNLVIRNNIIGHDSLDASIGFNGIYLAGSPNAILDGNQIFNISSDKQFLSALYISYNANNAVIERNNIHKISYIGSVSSGAWGLFADGSDNLIIKNNLVYDVISNRTDTTMGWIRNIAGIRINRGANIKLLNNSVNLFGNITANQPSFYAYALAISTIGEDSITIVNNILANSLFVSGPISGVTGAIAFYNTPDWNITVCDYNNYSYDNGSFPYFGYCDQIINNFMSWSATSGQDAHSIISNPLFKSDSLLIPNYNSGVYNSGLAIPGIENDYFGLKRSLVNPSIGAVENDWDFTAPKISFVKPENTTLTSNRILTAKIEDEGVGLDFINAPRLYYRKRTDLNDSLNWKISFGVWNSPDFTFVFDSSLVGGFNVGDYIEYFIVAQDLGNGLNPNVAHTSGIAFKKVDSVVLTNRNFPIKGKVDYYRIMPKLKDTLTVGIGGNYLSLTGDTLGLFKELNDAQIIGDLTVNIVSDLNESGFNSLNKLIRDGGDWKVNITTLTPNEKIISGSSKDADGLIRFIGVDNVHVNGGVSEVGKYLTFKNESETLIKSTISIASNDKSVSNISIKNTNIWGTANNSINSSALLITGNCNSLTIHDNFIKRAYNGIKIIGAPNTGNKKIKISNNYIGDNDSSLYIYNCGIEINRADSTIIANNEIVNVKSGLANNTGILVNTGCNNTLIEKNIVHGIWHNAFLGYGASGIWVNGSDSLKLLNNSIYDINGDGAAISALTTNPIAIKISGGKSHKIYFNSVNLYGNYIQSNISSASNSASFYIADSTISPIDIRNNSFVNTLTSSTLANNSFSYSIVFAGNYSFAANNVIIDYNNYYSNSSNINLNMLGRINNTNIVNLTGWKLATGQDLHSVSVNPLYKRDDYLAPSLNSMLLLAGQAIIGVSTDILDASRRNTPSIGAYEFEYLNSLPNVTTNSLILNLEQTKATTSGQIISHGGSAIIDKGMIIAKWPNLSKSINNQIYSLGSGNGIITANWTNLQPQTVYFYKAYAENSGGISYGSTETFTTLPNYYLPVFQNITIDTVKNKYAYVSSKILNDGNTPILSSGFIWGVNSGINITNYCCPRKKLNLRI